MPVVTCQNQDCGKSFEARPSDIKRGRGKYCCKSCASKSVSNIKRHKRFKHKYNYHATDYIREGYALCDYSEISLSDIL